MKKLLMLVAIASSLSLTACGTPSTGASPNPTASNGTSTGTNGSVSGRFATKAQFITWLNCLKNQPEVDVQAKSAIDAQISIINMIPDASWNLSANGFGSVIDAYGSYGAACK